MEGRGGSEQLRIGRTLPHINLSVATKDDLLLFAFLARQVLRFNVRFGSLADLFGNDRRMAAFEGKADIPRANFESLRPNVRFSPKRTFLPRQNRQI